jgi:hypothetical protein
MLQWKKVLPFALRLGKYDIVLLQYICIQTMQNFLQSILELGKVNPTNKVWAVQHSTLQMNKDLQLKNESHSVIVSHFQPQLKDLWQC